jgi:hypothetical protein
MRYLIVILMIVSPLAPLYPHETRHAIKVVLRRPVLEWPLWPLLWPCVIMSLVVPCVINNIE